MVPGFIPDGPTLLVWDGPKTGISSKFPGDAAADPATTVDTCWSHSSAGMAQRSS